jgi:hypothetical protein
MKDGGGVVVNYIKVVEDQKASLKHLKEHERERTGYKQMTVILQEVKIIQPLTSSPGLGKTFRALRREQSRREH